MAKYTGKIAELDIMDSAGSVVELALACNISSSDGVGIETTTEAIEATQLCDGAMEFIPGLRSSTLSFKLLYDDGAFSSSPQKKIEDLQLNGTTRTVKWRPNGTGTGKPEYTMSAFVESHSLLAAGGALVGADVGMKVSGEIVRTTLA